MTKVELLEECKLFLEKATADFSLPVPIQKGDKEQVFKSPSIYKMRVPKSGDAAKKTPYIIVRFLTGQDYQKHTQQSQSVALINLVFAIYFDGDEEEGAMTLLNLMETVRIAFMKQVVIGKCFKIDTDAGVESLAYPDDTAPYYGGEMTLNVLMPPTEREVFYG